MRTYEWVPDGRHGFIEANSFTYRNFLISQLLFVPGTFLFCWCHRPLLQLKCNQRRNVIDNFFIRPLPNDCVRHCSGKAFTVIAVLALSNLILHWQFQGIFRSNPSSSVVSIQSKLPPEMGGLAYFKQSLYSWPVALRVFCLIHCCNSASLWP